MEIKQTKLTRQEWNNLEEPIQGNEMLIIKFIHNSMHDLLANISNVNTLIEFMKIKDNNFHEYLYDKYYRKYVNKLNNRYGLTYKFKMSKRLCIKKVDILRINNYDKKIKKSNLDIYEDILLCIIKKLLKYIHKPDKFNYYYYTITQLITYKQDKINKFVLEYINMILSKYVPNICITNILKNSHKVIERNSYILRYKGIQLYKHQHDIINLFMQQSYNNQDNNNINNMLVLYQAPTATGKTMTPLALVNIKRIIFVCAARHVGLQLAKCCISLEIPIAIAFNCMSEDDIRLHYYAAQDYSRNYRTGGIWKVDNSIGNKVEIIISDIQSYLYAMDYMCTFNNKEDIIWYWDEPTITLDYSQHPYHKILENNWKNNIIPNIVLSSATLPNIHEIPSVINFYKDKFDNSYIHTIKSYEFNKTVPIINKTGYITLPHTFIDNAIDLSKCYTIINNNKTFLRHMDVKEITKFILYINKTLTLPNEYIVSNYFNNLSKLTILNIKLYYLELINILANNNKYNKQYGNIYKYFNDNIKRKYTSTIKITTSDAHTLTDGPTIFLTNNVDKLSSFYLSVSNIPDKEINHIIDIINKNRKYVNELDKIINNEENRLDKKDDKVLDRDDKGNEYAIKKKYREDVNKLKDMIKPIGLREYYIPNKKLHMQKWVNDVYTNVFTSDIPEKYIEEIVTLNINVKWKILLLMGIGVFMNGLSKSYMEIMKKLAYGQKLYLIIASSDYIYGTNYQFCHGYLGKEFYNMSREKIIQAMGRIGRHNNELDYTIRIRDDNIIKKLFLNNTDKPEINNMNRLFGI